jgi:hypothetical protein
MNGIDFDVNKSLSFAHLLKEISPFERQANNLRRDE